MELNIFPPPNVMRTLHAIRDFTIPTSPQDAVLLAAASIPVADVPDELERIDAELDRLTGEIWYLRNMRRELEKHANDPF